MRFALFGNPIQQSFSPQIHKLFAKQAGHQLNYIAITATKENFPQLLQQFVEHGGNGANITSPLKEIALSFCNVLSEYAKAAGSVNTLVLRDLNNCYGDNTDGRGFIDDLVKRLRFSPSHKRIIILGAGGAARAIVESLWEHQPRQIVVANRSLGAAQQLQSRWPKLTISTFFAIPDEEYDLIIDARAHTIHDKLAGPAKIRHSKASMAYTINYSNRAKPFLEWSLTQGIELKADGLGMLLAQAAYSYHLWTGFFPNWEKSLDCFH